MKRRGVPPQPLADRFWAKVSGPDANGCRHWLGYINPQTGYGQVSLAKDDAERFGSRIVTAPVLSCTLAHGPRPEGLVVLHSCDVRSCCEPSHLSWGTQQQNNREAWDRGRQLSGEDHHQARLTDEQVAEVVRRCRVGEHPKRLAEEFGVDWSLVYAWRRGEGRAARLKEAA